MMPLHVWLPRAHPVAPSHVSALMSGVMIKAGIYGMVRFGDRVSSAPGPAWWGLLVLGIGAASAVLGVLYALAEHDLKRLLAFHSVENIGIILLGLGVALIGSAQGAAGAGRRSALAAALFHSLNHAMFKALLFLGAGAVQPAAGTRDLNRLGGLARLMPVTALAFGVGAAAISGLPPLNGFASEWLTFQGLLVARRRPARSSRSSGSPATCAVGALALTAALAVACFVKATGMTFLALPRSDGAAGAHEVGPADARGDGRPRRRLRRRWASRPGRSARPSRASLAALRAAAPDPVAAAARRAADASGRYDPALLALALLLVAVAVAGRSVAAPAPGRRAARRPGRAASLPEPAFEYTATSFSKPLRLFFEPVLRPERELARRAARRARPSRVGSAIAARSTT